MSINDDALEIFRTSSTAGFAQEAQKVGKDNTGQPRRSLVASSEDGRRSVEEPNLSGGMINDSAATVLTVDTTGLPSSSCISVEH